MTNIVTIRNLKKYYDNGETKALNGINLDIEKGEFVSIIGPSGSGKSTLLNMIGALDTADSGSIIVDGVDLDDDGEDFNKFRSEKIGFVFQLHNLIPNLSVIDNVQIPLLAKHQRVNKSNHEKAVELLRSVGLADKINQNPTKMSGGQRQRVAIARALVNNPSIIIADEPTGALDSKTSDTIMDLLKRLHDESNVTLIIVTHDENIARQADRIITVKDGQIINNSLVNESEDDVSGSDDLLEYVLNEEDSFGTDNRKRIVFVLNNRRLSLFIRPLSSSEVRIARLNEEEDKGTFQENIVHLSATGSGGDVIPLSVIREKFPSGLTDMIAEKVLEYSRYGFR